MSEIDATTALRQAAELSAATRRAGRWYTTYLTVFAVATFAMCIGFGLMGGRWAAIVITPIWVLLVVALSVWSARQRSVVAGMGRIHAWVIGGWTVAWGVTVIVGSLVFPHTLAWWVLGGVLTAIPPVIGAIVTARRTRR
jgi:uncharacterized membrane protein YjjP (DUF1212 family)